MGGRATPPRPLAEHDAALADLLGELLAEVPVGIDQIPSPDTAKPLNQTGESPLSGKKPAEKLRDVRIPSWALGTFSALLFRVGKFQFAVPLVLMRGVVTSPADLSQLPGQPAWQRGVMRYREQSLVVADLGLLLGMPLDCGKPRYLLVIGEGREAFGCDDIDDTLTLCPDQVRWRTEPREDDHLPGFLADQMCGLLDADVISRKFRHE